MNKSNTAWETAELIHLEGESVLRQTMKSLSANDPPHSRIVFVSACLLHGRQYLAAAASAPLDTRPLLLYYAASSYAKALVVAKTGRDISAIKASHGLSGSFANGKSVGEYSVKILGSGLFQEFNDAVADLARFRHVDLASAQTIRKATAQSSDFSGKSINVVDLLARVPEIIPVFEMCTGSEPKSLPLELYERNIAQGLYVLSIEIGARIKALDDAKIIVGQMRTRAAFLSQWRVFGITRINGRTRIEFTNCPELPDTDEFSLLIPVQARGEQLFGSNPLFEQSDKIFDALQSLPTLAGGYGSLVAYIDPVEGHSMSEFSIILLGLYALSMLSRYHPDVWTSCVNRRRLGNQLPDDMLLPAINAFLDHASQVFPSLIVDVLLDR